MRRNRYFNRDGEEVSASRALRDGVLQNGYSIRVPTIFRDAASRQRFSNGRELFDSGEVCVTDATGSSGNRPGWRIADSAINRQAVHDARARYLSDLQSAYKNPSTGFGVQGAIGSQEGQPCTCRNAEYPEYFGAPGHLRNGVCVPDRADAAPDETDPRKRRVWEEPDEDDDDDADEEAEAVSDDDAPPFGAGDRRTVDQIAHDHRLRMDRTPFGAFAMAFRAMETREMIERERRRIHDPTVTSERLSPTGDSPSQATNGSGEITIDSPLPLKLAELERRISAALTEPRTASDLSDLLEQTDLGVIAATEHAKLENQKALDPLESPDPQAARQQAEDAAFMANRLRTMRPRLLARLQQVTAQEALETYRAKQSELAPERDALEQELATVYRDAAERIADLFLRIRAFERRARQDLGNPPANVEPLPTLAGAHLLDKVVLYAFDGQVRTWPPHEPFASDFSTSMRFDTHPGAAWCDPEIQQRQRAEREAEQARDAKYREQAARDEDARQNRELKERFSAHQPRQ